MSFEPVMPPFNSSDPSANFLSSSCLDFLLIELVPLAYRVTHDRDAIASEQNSTTADAASTSHAVSSSAAGIMAGAAARKDEEEDLDAVHYRLEMLGYRVGQGLVERFSRDRPRFNDTLDVIKFLCKDLWTLVFGKNIDNLKTNHRGVYVLTDNVFRPFSRMSTEAGGQAIVRAQPFLWFPCGIVTYAKLDGDREEVAASFLSNGLASGNTGKVDVAGLNKALLALDGTENLLGESVLCHGQGGGTSTVLGLDNFVTAELNAVYESILLGVGLASDLSNEGLGTDDVEGGDTKETLRVENPLGLEDLGRDGDSRVDWVGDDEDESLGGDLSSDLDETLDNASIDIEEIITGHSRLACAGEVGELVNVRRGLEEEREGL
ncbi:hypothetical protein HG531_007333 [Fusarium graminearum]|nr:hypothetical protein HG531_007333 [Fusarium graminearum]